MSSPIIASYTYTIPAIPAISSPPPFLIPSNASPSSISVERVSTYTETLVSVYSIDSPEEEEDVPRQPSRPTLRRSDYFHLDRFMLLEPIIYVHDTLEDIAVRRRASEERQRPTGRPVRPTLTRRLAERWGARAEREEMERERERERERESARQLWPYGDDDRGEVVVVDEAERGRRERQLDFWRGGIVVCETDMGAGSVCEGEGEDERSGRAAWWEKWVTAMQRW